MGMSSSENIIDKLLKEFGKPDSVSIYKITKEDKKRHKETINFLRNKRKSEARSLKINRVFDINYC